MGKYVQVRINKDNQQYRRAVMTMGITAMSTLGSSR